jgi:hypothetical protein
MGDVKYIAPTGFPQDWGLEHPNYKPAPMVVIQPRAGDDPVTLIAINGESRTTVQLTRKMLAKLLCEVSRESVREMERE